MDGWRCLQSGEDRAALASPSRRALNVRPWCCTKPATYDNERKAMMLCAVNRCSCERAVLKSTVTLGRQRPFGGLGEQQEARDRRALAGCRHFVSKIKMMRPKTEGERSGGSEGRPRRPQRRTEAPESRGKEPGTADRIGGVAGRTAALMSNGDRSCGHWQAHERESIPSWRRCRC
jgi:hypothetical protein